MTLKEFREAVNMLNEYWEVDACELIRELVWEIYVLDISMGNIC
jgi:hypothetical protein